MNSKLDFVPGVRVGPYYFGAPRSSLEKLGLVLMEDECSSGALTYGDGDEGTIRVYVEDACITGVGLYSSLLYKGINLIGTSLAEAESAIGKAPSSSETQELIDEEETIYYWDDLWLTLWVRDNIVVTAQCNEFIEDGDELI